jgi:hypothetical protein
MRQALVLLGVLVLCACGTPAPESSPPAPMAQAPAGPPQRTPIPEEPAPDACGAKAMQHLVGRPRSEIPAPINPNRQRVACTTCPVTMDYNIDRLNFFFDAQTGIIKEVRCG